MFMSRSTFKTCGVYSVGPSSNVMPTSFQLMQPVTSSGPWQLLHVQEQVSLLGQFGTLIEFGGVLPASLAIPRMLYIDVKEGFVGATFGL